MTDEGRDSPLPQRERGATEAGAQPAPATAGPRALSDELRQRMQASVDAERSQARERMAEVLRQPPRRLAHAERPSWPSSNIQDRKSGGWRKRRAKTEQADQPGTRAAGGPEIKAAIAKNAAPVNSAPAGTVSAAPAPVGLAALESVLTETVPPAGGAADRAPAPAGSPSVHDLPPGHPSGPSATQAARAAAPAPPAPAAPAPGPTSGRSGVVRAVLVVAAMAVVVAGASVGVIMAMAGSGASHPGHTAAGPGAGTGTTSQQAAAWVAGQVSPATIVSCDRAMCAALEAHGYPARDVRTLDTTTTLKRSGLVVVTPAARQQFGSSLATAWAPDALATFGSGSSAVSVRIVAPGGAAAYQREVRQGQAERASAEAALAGVSSVTAAAPAAKDLRSGLVDGRLMQAIADADVAEPVDIVDFGNVGTGASADVPLRYADLAASNPEVGLSVSAYVHALEASINDGPGPNPARTQLLTVQGRQVLRLEFLAPSPFGVLSTS